MQPRNIITLSLLALSLANCATTGGDDLKFGTRLPELVDDETFQTEVPGTVRIDVYPQDGKSCDNTNKPESEWVPVPVVTVTSQTEYVTRLKVTCDPSKQFFAAVSEAPIAEGRYTIDVDHADDPRGRLRFYPVEPERLSGADKLAEGSTKMADGVNQGSINPSKADATDWWIFDVKTFTPYSIVYQHDANAEDVTVTLFNKQGGRLRTVATLKPDQVYNRRMEGTYFIKVKGKDFTGEANYSISAQKGDTPAEAAEKRDQYENISVTDLWHMDGSKTAILVEAGTAKGVKVGDSLKLFNRGSNEFVGACVAVGSSDRETECHLDSVIALNSKLVARKAL